MGEFVITGKAERNVEIENIEIEITFQSIAKSSSDVIRKVTEQCEKFLSTLDSVGFDISKIVLRDSAIVEDISDGMVRGRKVILINAEFNMKLINYIDRIVEENGFETFINIDYFISSESKERIHNELLQEALNNSKEKAQLAADTLNMNIISVSKVEIQDASFNISDNTNDIFSDITTFLKSKELISNKLKAPKFIERKTVTVTWKIE